LLYKGQGAVSDKLGVVLLCKQMKWDYYTFMQQPEWFVNLIRLTNNLDAEYQEKLNRIAARQSRKK
jgi:hypothetical protein